MNDILNKYILFMSVIVLFSCNSRQIKFDIGESTVVFKNYYMKEDKTMNSVTDVPMSEFFLVDSVNNINLTILHNDDVRFNHFTNFESRYHQFCQDSDNSYPSYFFRVRKNKKYSKDNLEISELIYRRESNKYYPTVIVSLVDKAGYISLRFHSTLHAENLHEMIDFQNDISDNVSIIRKN